MYSMKLFVIQTSAYKEGAIPPTDKGFADWANAEIGLVIRKNNLSFDSAN